MYIIYALDWNLNWFRIAMHPWLSGSLVRAMIIYAWHWGGNNLHWPYKQPILHKNIQLLHCPTLKHLVSFNVSLHLPSTAEKRSVQKVTGSFAYSVIKNGLEKGWPATFACHTECGGTTSEHFLLWWGYRSIIMYFSRSTFCSIYVHEYCLPMVQTSYDTCAFHWTSSTFCEV